MEESAAAGDGPGSSGRWIDVLAAIVVLAFVGLFGALGLRQYEAGRSVSFDLALYARGLWGAAHGAPHNPLRAGQHFLALHSHFIFYLLGPLTRWFAAAKILLFGQALAVAAGAGYMYLLACRQLGNRWHALGLAFALLVYPVVGNTLLFDAHPKVMSLPLLLWLVMRFRDEKLDGLWLLGFVVAFSCREDVGLLLGSLGIAHAFLPRYRRSGIGLAALGLGAFAAYQLGLRPLLQSDMASSQAHFAHLFEWEAWVLQLGRGRNVYYVVASLAGLALLPLAPAALCIAAPAAIVMGLGCLSRISGAVMLQNHYPFMAVPFLWLATLAGLGQLHSWRSAWTGWAVALLCLCSVTLYIVEGAGPGGVHYEPSAYEMDAESTAARRCLSKVPASSALLAELSISALAADRKTLYTHMPPADVALDHAVLEVEPAGRFAALPGYLRYVASQRALAVTLAAERGMVELARCGPYMLLGNR